MPEFNSDDEASKFNSGANAFFDATRESRALKAAIMATVGPNVRKVLGTNFFSIAELAIEAIGKGDPESVLRIYGAGGKLDDSVVLALDSAVEFSRRKKTNAADEFQRLAQMHDWNF